MTETSPGLLLRWTPPGARGWRPTAAALRVPEPPPEGKDGVRLLLGAANVLTLLPDAKEQGLGVPGRASALALQFQLAGIHIIGVQETRLRTSEPSRVEGYYCIHSPATPQGHGGVSLWINTRCPVDADGEVGLRPDHFQLLTADHRTMVVACHAPFLTCHLVVAHGFSSNTLVDQMRAKAYWMDLETTLRDLSVTTDVVLLADANASVGSDASPHVGPVQGSPEDSSGAALHRFLRDRQLHLPSTFEEDPHGGFTWTSPDGQTEKRLDYVGVPIAWKGSVARARVDRDICLALKRRDHRVPTVLVHGNLPGTQAAPILPRPVFSRKRLADPQVAAALRTELSAFVSPPWRTSVDDHHEAVFDALRGALERHAGGTSGGPGNPGCPLGRGGSSGRARSATQLGPASGARWAP